MIRKLIRSIVYAMMTIFAIAVYLDLHGLFAKSGNNLEFAAGPLDINISYMGILWLVAAIILMMVSHKLRWKKRKLIALSGTMFCLTLGYILGFVYDSLTAEFQWIIVPVVLVLSVWVGFFRWR